MTGPATTPRAIRRVVAGLFWLGVWEAAALMVGHPLLLPSPWDTACALARLFVTPAFWASVWSSFFTIVGAFVGAFGLALGMGGLAASREWLQDLVRPIALVLKATPVACIVVLLLLWVGSAGVPSAAVALMVFPAYYFSMVKATQQANPLVREALQVMGVGPGRLFLVHTWPEVLPYLVATSQNAVGMSWKAGVAAELIAMAANTFGEKIYQAKLLLETADLFAWTVTIVVVAFGCERLFCALLAQSGSWTQRWALKLTPHAPREASREVLQAGPHASAQNAPYVAFQSGARQGDDNAVLRVFDLTVERGGQQVVSHASFWVDAGRALCLWGPSGRGKSTLLAALLGLIPIQEGSVERPRALSAVFQETRLVETLSIEDNVRLVAPGTSCERVRAALAELLPSIEASRLARDLSGGQRRRVELVRALLCPGGAVFLDEPFQGLDDAAHHQALLFVKRHLGARALVIATHDPLDAELLQASYFEL